MNSNPHPSGRFPGRLKPVAKVVAGSTNSLRESDFTLTTAQNSERRLMLDTIYRPLQSLYFGAGEFLNLIWRIIRAVLQRIARTFGVSVDAPQEPPHDDAGASANFVADADDLEGADNVQKAAQSAAVELSKFVSKLVNSPLDFQAMKGPGAEAYLALVLTDMGQSMVGLRAGIERKKSRALALAGEGSPSMADSIGVSPESVLALFEAMKEAPGGSSIMDYPKAAELFETVKAIQADQTTLVKLQFSFCDHAIAALRSPGEEVLVKDVANAKIIQFADRDMTNIIFEEAARENVRNNDVSSDNSSLPQLNLQKIDSVASLIAAIPEAASGKTGARRSRVGWSVGSGVDEVEPEDLSQKQVSSPRMRN